MGGRGNSGSRNTDSTLLKTVQDWVTHHLTNGVRTSIVTDAEIISKVDKNGEADVRVSYEDSVRVLVGYDSETNQAQYDYETEYHTNTFRLKVGTNKDTEDSGYTEWRNTLGYKDNQQTRERYEQYLEKTKSESNPNRGKVKKATPYHKPTHSKYRAGRR